MIIVIDDERTFALEKPELPGYVEVKYARTSAEGIALIANAWTDFVLRYGNMVDLYLDHDLGENDTIRPVVDFLYVAGKKSAIADSSDVVKPSNFIANIYVHSQNPTTDWIVDLLSPLYSNVKRIPLPELVV